MTNKKNILITGVGGRSIGSGILHALLRSHSASQNKWNVIPADANPFSWGLYKTKFGLILPFATANNYIEQLLNTIERYKIDAVIPGTEIETEILSHHAESFPVPLIINNKELIPLMMDKDIMRKKMDELGLTFIPNYPLEQWELAVKDFGYPLIAKPTKGTGGSRGLAILLNENEILNYFNSSDLSNNPVIQPYIGDPDEEYTIGVLSDKSGKLIDSIVMKRKLLGVSLLNARQFSDKSVAISTGYSQGYIIKHQEIQNFCEKLSSKIGSCGPLNIQLRKDNKELYVFEIHPRFSGTTPMRADVGFNEPDILLRNYLFDEKFDRVNYQYDVAVIRAFEHVVVPIAEMLTL